MRKRAIPTFNKTELLCNSRVDLEAKTLCFYNITDMLEFFKNKIFNDVILDVYIECEDDVYLRVKFFIKNSEDVYYHELNNQCFVKHVDVKNSYYKNKECFVFDFTDFYLNMVEKQEDRIKIFNNEIFNFSIYNGYNVVKDFYNKRIIINYNIIK